MNIHSSYDEIAESFMATRERSWPEFDLMKKYIQEGDSILDVGCAHGRLYNFLQQEYKTILYHGIDTSRLFIDEAQRRYGSSLFTCVDMSEYRPKEKVDVIICVAAFHHLENKEMRLRTLAHWYDSLQPGGRIVLIVWNLFQPKYRHFILEGVARACIGKGHIGDTLIPWTRDGHSALRYYYAFRRGELASLVAKAGFEIESCQYTPGLGNSPFVSSSRNIMLVAYKR